jgi:hypothetical protein
MVWLRLRLPEGTLGNGAGETPAVRQKARVVAMAGLLKGDDWARGRLAGIGLT